MKSWIGNNNNNKERKKKTTATNMAINTNVQMRIHRDQIMKMIH